MNIIGGPALRRVTTKHVYVWLVLDEKALSVKATISTSQTGNSLA